MMIFTKQLGIYIHNILIINVAKSNDRIYRQKWNDKKVVKKLKYTYIGQVKV